MKGEIILQTETSSVLVKVMAVYKDTPHAEGSPLEPNPRSVSPSHRLWISYLSLLEGVDVFDFCSGMTSGSGEEGADHGEFMKRLILDQLLEGQCQKYTRSCT
ncbi:hypothetical protein JZ751_012092 [Albula glossodonta]|uniref:Uncharacterized protein n=1 Tax=Albula glossodonta TaxID=121402 RepID=A0A8T2PRL7_9TELE|nr:hypothetical protein JZ751_012092 [Albula glossodonta]